MVSEKPEKMINSYAGMRGPALQVLIGAVAGLSFFLFGYDQGDLASILTVGSFRRRFPQTDTIGNPGSSHTAVIQGITVGIWNLGCFVSAMLTIFWGDRVGRRKTILCGLIFLGIGEIIQASSFSYAQFMVGRAIAGFGNGFNAATTPAWQAECTKAHRRGTLLMITAGTFIAAGLSFSYWMGFAFSFLDPSSAAWRVPIAIQLVFLLFTGLLLTLMPESPRWLILHGREDQAFRVLSALNDLPRDDHQIRQEFLQIKDAVIEMSKGDMSSAVKNGDYRHGHRVFLATLLQVFQQGTGINLITQFLALMFIEQYNYRGWVARLLAACVGTEFFLSSFVSVIGLDRFWGRRSLMMFGATGMCASMAILAGMLYLDTSAGRIVGTVFLFVYLTFFAIGWQGMAWLYQVEVVPLRIRGPANALSTAANWLVNYAIVQIAPIAFHNIGYRTYIIFAVINFVIVPAIYFLYPETGFRSLEEVDVIFYNAGTQPKPWLNVVKIAANEPLWYGKGNEADGDANPFVYEDSEWHKKHLRFSDEVKTSDGETTTLQGGGSTSPDSGKKVSDNSNSSGTAAQSTRGGQASFLESGYGRDEMAVSPITPDENIEGGTNANVLVSPDEAGGFHQGYISGLSEVTTPADDDDDDDAAPSPNISRTSVDRHGRRLRSAGRA